MIREIILYFGDLGPVSYCFNTLLRPCDTGEELDYFIKVHQDSWAETLVNCLEGDSVSAIKELPSPCYIFV